MPSVFQNLETSNAAIETAAESIDAKTPALVSGSTPVAVRRDSEDGTASDGAVSPLFVNQVGRLKVSAMPGMYTPITGDITANGQTVSAAVDRASNVMIRCTGTFAGSNCTFEGSIDGGTTWFAVQACRTNANTIETTTGVLGAAPAYAWEMSVNALTNVRVRATAFTSGTQSWRILPGAYATEPIPAIQTHPVTGSGTFTVAGTATTTPVTPTTTRTVTTASTNTAAIKASAGTVYNLSVFNSSGATVFVKMYNQTTAPTLASAVPALVVPVTAGALLNIDFGPLGERYATGIAIAVTGGVANTDTTNTAAGINVNTTFI